LVFAACAVLTTTAVPTAAAAIVRKMILGFDMMLSIGRWFKLVARKVTLAA
jgi:hypothetical protein